MVIEYPGSFWIDHVRLVAGFQAFIFFSGSLGFGYYFLVGVFGDVRFFGSYFFAGFFSGVELGDGHLRGDYSVARLWRDSFPFT